MNTALEMTMVIVGLQVLATPFPYVSGEVPVMVFNDNDLQNQELVNENKAISNVGPDRLHYLKQGSDDAHLLKDYKRMSQFDLHEEIGSNCMSRNVEVVKVSLDTRRIINVVDDCFLSFALDSYLMEPSVHWLKFNFSSPKIYTLLAAISPAMLRVGGSPADWLFFNKPFDVIGNLDLKPSAIVMTKMDITNLVGLTKSTGNRLLFDLNLQLRFGLQWNPTNAIELLEFCSEMGFGDNMDWELGNEPDSYSAAAQMTLTPERIGNDFVLLNSLLHLYPNMATSRIVGPDVVGTGGASSPGLKIIQGVANATGSFLKAITFHHYYFRGDTATIEDYLNPENFANLASSIQHVQNAIRNSKFPHLSFWLGETSDAWHSGTENVSDRFVSGFLWMDKLGLSAKMGVKVVVRQTLYGHYYSLLDVNMDPTPDFWLSWLHRLLVGNGVLSVLPSAGVNVSTPDTFRIYAHCTNTKSIMQYKKGSVTMFGLNVNPLAAVSISFTGSLVKEGVDVYLLEPDGPKGVLSKWVKLNGERLLMTSDLYMPDIYPKKLPPGSKVLLPPLTFAFFVFPDADVMICQ